MRKKKTLNFNKKAKQKRPLLIWSCAVVAVLLVGLLSFVALFALNDFSLEKLLGARSAADDETTTVQITDETTQSAQPYTDENAINFLALCVDSTDNITFCDIVSVSVAENTIRIKPVSPEIKFDYSGTSVTLQELYAENSVKTLCEVFSERSFDIDRWTVMSESSFKTIMKNLGEVEIYLEEDVSYVVDSITYTLNAGTRSMTSETLLNYLKHAGEGDELALLQAEALAKVIETHFTAENLQKGEAFFSTLINLVDTNITAFDYNNSFTAILDFINNSPEVSVIN